MSTRYRLACRSDFMVAVDLCQGTLLLPFQVCSDYRWTVRNYLEVAI